MARETHEFSMFLYADPAVVGHRDHWDVPQSRWSVFVGRKNLFLTNTRGGGITQKYQYIIWLVVSNMNFIFP